MNFDFTTMLERHGKDALAVDGLRDNNRERNFAFSPSKPTNGKEAIPLWVADMNFATSPAIPEAIIERAKHPAYGYYATPDAWYDAIISWHERRNHVRFDRSWIGYENGVLGGLMSAVRSLEAPGSRILVNSPTYIGFTNALTGGGYRLVTSELQKDSAGIFRMDLADMEEKLRKYHIHTAICCSPHNPTGRVWERQELEDMMALYRKYDVTVLCDEIWSDLILPGYTHTPLLSLGEDARNRTIAFYAPSKTYNLAGLIGSYHVIPNPALRDRVYRESMRTGYNHQCVLSMHALIAAYGKTSETWLEELKTVLNANVDFAMEETKKHLPGVSISRPQGTYMLWEDAGEYLRDHNLTLGDLVQKGWDAGVDWQSGEAFHGKTHIRLNLALPTAKLQEAYQRMENEVF